MIQEDYVSYKTAKLLKEKGFDENTNCYYIDGSVDKNLCYSPIRQNHNKRITNNEFDINIDITSGKISAPTLQMTMKWLREVHHYYIQVMLDSWACGGHMGYYIVMQKTDSNWEMMLQDVRERVFYDKPEEAAEDAIMYIVENLI